MSCSALVSVLPCSSTAILDCKMAAICFSMSVDGSNAAVRDDVVVLDYRVMTRSHQLKMSGSYVGLSVGFSGNEICSAVLRAFTASC